MQTACKQGVSLISELEYGMERWNGNEMEYGMGW